MNLQTAFRAFLESTCRLLFAVCRDHPRRLASRIACCAGASLLTACATLPQQPTERAYYIDARKALHAESRLGWTVDRVEIAEASVQAEPSACRVSPAHRKALKLWVAERIAAEGGPAEQQFRAGTHIDDLDHVVDLERTQALLDQVELHVPADCPYWIRPSEQFHGLHTTAHRLVLIAESMGGGSLSISRGQVTAGGGGAARGFVGYGFSQRFMAAAGFEAGGDATLQKQKADSGVADSAFAPEGAFRFGVPAIVRLTDIDRIYDLELAAVARLSEGKFTPWGARVALAGGVAGLRRIGFMPAIQLWFGYEVYPAQNNLAVEHVLRLGTRVGVDWHR
ncbi:MAG: hypothetical protein JWN48_5298 [Myxococcaceae bacterium]|nr:hypothetical protein [Myxococcaceae bacterium]